jgi:hypothetical protein
MYSEEGTLSPKPRNSRAFNAYRHGLTGHVLVIEPGEELAYKQHCEGIHQSLAPVGTLELDLVQSIADDRWRLKRAAAIESNLFALGLNRADDTLSGNAAVDTALHTARLWYTVGKELERMTLYESRIQRHIEKNLALVRQLQSDRREALQKLVAEAAVLGDAYTFPPEALPPHFVFSEVQIRALAKHHRRLADAQKQLRRAA